MAEIADLSAPPIASSVTADVKSSHDHRSPLPNPFFDVHVHDASHAVPLLGLCAGFESGNWRAAAFADHLMDHLIEFALTRDEWQNVNTATAYRALRRAARTVYLTDKYQNRGEVGELLLHAVMRHHYGTEPIVSKFYFKSAANDTVKGFDAAHVVFVNPPEDLELWLGEAKLYIDVDAAIRDVCGELSTHLSGFIQLTYHNQGVDCGSHCERDNGSEDFDIEITMDMISAGVKAIDNHDPDREDKEALVFAILYRGFAIAKRNANARLSHS